MIDPRKLKGAAALIEIAERLKTFGAEVEKALESGEGRERNFDLETPMGKMSGRFGVRMGPAARPAAPGASAARKPARPAPRTPDPLIDVHFDGVHLIVTQSADGSLIVGDSHHYGAAADPFMTSAVEKLILDEFRDALGFPPPPVIERWTGVYASAEGMTMFAEAPAPDVRLVMVTSGTGASTAFAIAENVIGELYGEDLEKAA